MNQSSLNDILKEYLIQYGWSRHFMLYPDTWNKYSLTHVWKGEKLDITKAKDIPDESGIYTLILQPGIANHPACSYLMYVGQTNSLRRRFREYLTSEKKESGRPRLFVFLNLYDGFICFYYTPVKMEALNDVEDNLTVAYQPPLNKELKGTTGISRNAFT
jgi:excinuclease UvrABC nuclease subunit